MDYFIRENNTHFNLAPTIIYKTDLKRKKKIANENTFYQESKKLV